MRRCFSFALFALASLACGACGTAAGGSDVSGNIVQTVMDAAVDDADRGIVGLAIDFNGFYFSGHCSGTLIAPNLVLTAHHCVSLTSGGGSQGEVICGQTGFGFTGQGQNFLASPETHRPNQAGDPSFYRGTDTVRTPPGENDLCGRDVALIILEGAGVPEADATPVIPRIDSTPEPADEFSAVGFGLTDPNDNASSGVRMRKDGNQVSCIGTDCSSLGVRDTEWGSDAPVCPGDSGGPAIDSKGRVMGVVSRGGTGCVTSIYGDVGSWKDWIIETALEAATLGGYEPPFWATTGSSKPPPPPPPPPPEVDPNILGTACGSDDPCSYGYVCFSRDGTSDGECVPPCAQASDECPESYTCSPEIGACIGQAPPAANAADGGESSGCSVAAADPAKPLPWVAIGLGICWGFARRRASRARG